VSNDTQRLGLFFLLWCIKFVQSNRSVPLHLCHTIVEMGKPGIKNSLGDMRDLWTCPWGLRPTVL